jgi:hypothetical protein
MSNSASIKALLVILGIGAIVASIFLVVKPKNETCKQLQSEIIELQARYDDLCEKEKHKDEYIAETEEFNRQFDEELINYPADLNQETTVMFLKGVEENVIFRNNTVSLPRPATYYVLGGEDAADDEDSAGQYVVETEQYNVSYSGSYEGFQDYIDYIETYKYRMNVSAITVAYNSEATDPIDECAGTVTVNAYSISGPDRTPDKPVISDVKEGKPVIFEDESGGSKASTSFDSDNGASIVSDHNVVILLNNAGNDSASGIIVASNESNEDTYVTSSSNKVENLDITISEEDGKNYIEYAIGSESYRAEVLSKNVTIYVKSSERVNSDDKNGVKMNVSNNTDLSVYVKVSDDDSTSPRFEVGSKTGTVKVY